MEVILLNDVDALGLRGEVVNVARGYARNFLLPRRLAEPATPAKVAELRKRDEQRARHEARTVEQAQERAEILQKTVLRFEVKAGPTGSLFGSVTPTQIADELWRTRKVRVDRRKIGSDAIKRIGRYDIPIELFQDVRVEVYTIVVPEGGELPSDDELAAMEAVERAEQKAAAGEAPAEGADQLEAILAAEESAATEVETGDEPETVTSGETEAPAAEAESATEAEPVAEAEAAAADEPEATQEPEARA
jgi:large subunit ribosomal protein L9